MSTINLTMKMFLSATRAGYGDCWNADARTGDVAAVADSGVECAGLEWRIVATFHVVAQSRAGTGVLNS
jgi:hypothetical protein